MCIRDSTKFVISKNVKFYLILLFMYVNVAHFLLLLLFMCCSVWFIPVSYTHLIQRKIIIIALNFDFLIFSYIVELGPFQSVDCCLYLGHAEKNTIHHRLVYFLKSLDHFQCYWKYLDKCAIEFIQYRLWKDFFHVIFYV